MCIGGGGGPPAAGSVLPASQACSASIKGVRHPNKTSEKTTTAWVGVQREQSSWASKAVGKARINSVQGAPSSSPGLQPCYSALALAPTCSDRA